MEVLNLRSRKLMSSVAAPLLAVSALFAIVTATSTASALPLLTISGSARGLYGNPTGEAELNPYGLGLGLRLGVTLPASLYLGGSFDYFFGESDTRNSQEVSLSLLQLMGRVGYDLGVGPITLRPQLGLGYAQSSSEFEAIEDSESDFVLAPGVEFTFGLGLLSIGAEASYNKVFAGDDQEADAVVLGLGLGFSI
jgi:Outer membrane protein beta-barrel domain